MLSMSLRDIISGLNCRARKYFWAIWKVYIYNVLVLVILKESSAIVHTVAGLVFVSPKGWQFSCCRCCFVIGELVAQPALASYISKPVRTLMCYVVHCMEIGPGEIDRYGFPHQIVGLCLYPLPHFGKLKAKCRICSVNTPASREYCWFPDCTIHTT